MLVPFLLLAPAALAVEIEAPKAVPAGEAFHVVARVVNRSEKPVVIVRPQVTNHELGVGFGGGLLRGGKPVPTTVGGMQTTQWVLSHRFGPEAFQTLKPGESVEIEDVEYRREYADGPFSGLKSDLRTAKTKDLAPGEYTVRFSYGFRPEFHVKRLQRRGPKPELQPEGRTLYRQAWTGNAIAETTVTVGGA